MDNDKIILKKIYELALNDFNTKNKKNKKGIDDIIRKLSSSVTELELYLNEDIAYSINAIVAVKQAYYEYCEFVHLLNGKDLPENIANKAKLYIDKVVELDARIISEYRKKVPAGNRINLSKLAEDKSFRLCIVKISADKAMETWLNRESVNIKGNGKIRYVFTETDSKLHLSDCPNCRNVTTYPASSYNLNYMDFEYCDCVKKVVAVDIDKKDSTNGLFVPKEDSITAFIDESLRENPFSNIYRELAEYVGIYSYIVCQGGLRSESEITANNTMWTDVGEVKELYDSNNIAMYTIKKVLIDIRYELGFKGNIIIYTDNQTAADKAMKWIEEDEIGKDLISFFKSVTIIRIPREENKIADNIGRNRSIISVPTSVYKSMYDTIMGNSK